MAYFLLALFVIVFFLSSLMYFQHQEYELAAIYGMGCLILPLFTGIYLFVFKPIEKKLARDRFLDWIWENRKNILNNKESSYKGAIVTKDTILIRYCIVYSLPRLFSLKRFSKFCIKGSFRSCRIGILSTIFILLTGWIAIPWGIVYTIQALKINLNKTESITVGELIELMTMDETFVQSLQSESSFPLYN